MATRNTQFSNTTLEDLMVRLMLMPMPELQRF